MSFGFSAGDFITFGKLVGEITTSLRDVGGAKSEYQQLIRELSSLESALRQLDRLNEHTTEAEDVDAVKYAALNCRHSLEEFQKKTTKYERSLDVPSKTNGIRSTSDKVRWTLTYDDDVRRLRAHLSVQTGTIVMVLTKIYIERLDAHDAKADLDAEHVRSQLDNTKTMLGNIQRNLPAQALMVGQVHSMLGGLCKFVFGEIKTAIQHFSQVVDKVYTKAEEIHTLVLDLRNSKPQVDTRWTYFQEPFVVEDALGFKFPVPSEYDFTTLDGIIRLRFRAGAGSLEVDAGNYELCHTNKRSETVTSRSRLRPGNALTMVIIMDMLILNGKSCPMPRCDSMQASTFPGGGFVCSVCGVWFDHVTEKASSVKEVVEILETTHINPCAGCLCCKSIIKAKRKRDCVDDDIAAFKNVKCFCSNPALDSRLPEILQCPIGSCSRTFTGTYRHDIQQEHLDSEHANTRARMRCSAEGCTKVYHRVNSLARHYQITHRPRNLAKKRSSCFRGPLALPSPTSEV